MLPNMTHLVTVTQCNISQARNNVVNQCMNGVVGSDGSDNRNM
jgi:hypothetical protein